ncbi:MAG: JAB domain-containing protein [Halanaerobiales bacterium]
MLNIYCWRCGTQINKSDILGLGHFDEQIGKYQGKAFVAFECPGCQKIRYQIMDTNILSTQKKKAYRSQNELGHLDSSCVNDNEIDINQVIDFFEVLNEISTVDSFLEKCKEAKEAIKPEVNKPIVQPLDVYNLFNDVNKSGLKRLMILTLNKENRLITWEFLGEKTNKEITFDPKVIFHTPFLLDQKDISIIIARNLLGSFNKPSQKDILLTKRLVKTGKILGIDFLDHIIIGDNGYHSFDQLDLL